MNSTEEMATEWRVRFEKHDGMFAFIDLKMSNGHKLTRREAENWARVTLKENPTRYAKVAKVYSL